MHASAPPAPPGWGTRQVRPHPWSASSASRISFALQRLTPYCTPAYVCVASEMHGRQERTGIETDVDCGEWRAPEAVHRAARERIAWWTRTARATAVTSRHGDATRTSATTACRKWVGGPTSTAAARRARRALMARGCGQAGSGLHASALRATPTRACAMRARILRIITRREGRQGDGRRLRWGDVPGMRRWQGAALSCPRTAPAEGAVGVSVAAKTAKVGCA